ncbi:MAG: aminomethyl-transferring glycine dehydrogenase subunit GcvPB [Verrucomicrobiae bacterium]|nr:aminomethyl-transferring glycine dehydrogenase subunit GcvPB [Verrucomicrobiae bacterium]
MTPGFREALIFEKSSPGHRAARFPEWPGEIDLPPELKRSAEPALPEISEIGIVRHFTRLSQLNFSVDTHFYPLGSCTMKYNPKINDRVAGLPGFAQLHPLQPAEQVQGVLRLLKDLEGALCELCGMDAFSLQPAAGAHGELAGMLMIRAYHESRRENRTKVIVPASAHGTNPASAKLAGYEIVTLASESGIVDAAELKRALGPDVAAIMLTNPNTLGLFERNIQEIAKLAHDAGALLYYDGANMNALLGLARPGDMGFDVVHLNLHKSFSTPHGGGGPGAGPVGVKKRLEPFLPVPRLISKKANAAELEWSHDFPQSIGKMRSFYGNVGVLVRAYTYIRANGLEGLTRVSRAAIANANYLKEQLKKDYRPYSDEPCMHECVLICEEQKKVGVTVRDIAKRLLDFDFHSPTIAWPVHDCVMIEPTETETRATLDRFIGAMRQIAKECRENADFVKHAPYRMPVRRLDEVRAARELNLRSPG